MDEVERFIQLYDYPQYEVSSFGYIRNLGTGRKLKAQVNANGSRFVILRKLGQSHVKTVARLVAEEFVEGFQPDKSESRWPQNTPVHLDHNKDNCRASNLKWMPRWMAIKWEQEWKEGPRNYQTVIDTMTAKEYQTAWHCAQSLGILEHIVLMQADDYNAVEPRFQFTDRKYKTIREMMGY